MSAMSPFMPASLCSPLTEAHLPTGVQQLRNTTQGHSWLNLPQKLENIPAFLLYPHYDTEGDKQLRRRLAVDARGWPCNKPIVYTETPSGQVSAREMVVKCPQFMFLRTRLLFPVLLWSHPNKVIPFTALWVAWWQTRLSEEHWDFSKAYSLPRQCLLTAAYILSSRVFKLS